MHGVENIATHLLPAGGNGPLMLTDRSSILDQENVVNDTPEEVATVLCMQGNCWCLPSLTSQLSNSVAYK